MAEDMHKKMERLLGELQDLTQRVADLEALDAERSRAQQALRESERQFRALFDGAPDAVFLADPESGVILDANSAASRLLLTPREEIIGRHQSELHPARHAEQVREVFRERTRVARQGGEPRSVEAVVLRSDGTEVPVEILAETVDLHGKPVFQGIFRDLTDRKRAEEERQRVSDQLQASIEHMPMGYILWDRDFHVLEWNPEAEKIFGFSRSEMLGRYGPDLIVPEAARGLVGETLKSLQQGVPAHYSEEHNNRRKDGSLISCRWHNTPLKDTNGDVTAILSMAEEVTQQLRAERAHRESEELYRDFIEGTDDLVTRVDSRGRLTFVNRRADSVFGLDPTKCIGLSAFDFVHPDDRKDTEEAFNGWVRDRVPSATYENRQVSRAGNTRDMLWTINLHFDESGHLGGIVGIARDITERKRAEEALRTSQRQYQTLFDEMLDGASLHEMIYDENGTPSDYRFLHVNGAFERITGLKAEALLGNTVREVLPDIDSHWIEICGKVALTGEPVHFEQYSTPLDRHYKVAAFRPDKDQFAVVFSDITDRKNAEEGFKERQEQLNDLLANVDAIILEGDPLDVYFVGGQVERMLGYPKERWFEDPEGPIGFWRKHLHPADLEKAERCARAIANGQNHSFEYRLIAADGREVWFYDSVTVETENGKPVKARSVMTEITERKKAEESRRRLETAIEQAAEVVVITDTDGTIQYVNPAFERLTGYALDEALGQNPRLLKSGVHDATFYRQMWDTLSCGSVWTGHIINRAKDGSLFEEEATISPIRDADGKITNYVAVKRDVTREAELEGRLRQAQKMEAVGTLAGGIAHDFNNLLQAMLGYLDLARAEVAKDSAAVKFLEEVSDAGNRATDLVRQILAFSRQSEQERQPMLLQPIVKEALKLLRASLPSTIELRQVIDPGCGTVTADPTAIHQVLMNLCTNAYHAMREEGGVLEVTLEEVNMGAERAAVIPNLESGRHARLAVRDTGHGMDKATMERVFDPYFTTKRVNEGTGLGLATVLGIVKSSRGAVTVDSELGEGTVFEVFLPLIHRIANGEQAQVTEDVTPAGNERVLFVDDEPAVAEIGRLGLERLGYRVEMRTSSIEALEAFRFAPGSFDVVITDLTMPHMTGLELAREILRIRPDTPIIVCTGFSELIDEEIAKAAGIRAYVHKPVLPHALGKAVRQVLDSEEQEP
jgi:PAS domain S-box-containing protein